MTAVAWPLASGGLAAVLADPVAVRQLAAVMDAGLRSLSYEPRSEVLELATVARRVSRAAAAGTMAGTGVARSQGVPAGATRCPDPAPAVPAGPRFSREYSAAQAAEVLGFADAGLVRRWCRRDRQPVPAYLDGAGQWRLDADAVDNRAAASAR